MKFLYNIEIEVPDSELVPCLNKSFVKDFIKREIFFAGGCAFSGNEEHEPSPEWVLYRHGCIKIK